MYDLCKNNNIDNRKQFITTDHIIYNKLYVKYLSATHENHLIFYLDLNKCPIIKNYLGILGNTTE